MNRADHSPVQAQPDPAKALPMGSGSPHRVSYRPGVLVAAKACTRPIMTHPLPTDGARTGCSVLLTDGQLIIDHQHILGDLKLFEPKTMYPIIAVRDREGR